MANEALRQYMVERLVDLDPTLSTSDGSPMYTKVIDPLVSRLGVDPLSVNIEEFIVQRLKDDPVTRNLDIEGAGSFLKDVLARAIIVLLEPLQREIEALRKQQSFANIDELNSDEMDALLSNIFATRRTGSFAYGVVRIYYSAPQTVTFDSSIIFSTATGLQFIPSDPEARADSDFVKEGDLYYIEIDAQSLVPHVGANIPENTIKFVSGLDNVVKVTNPEPFEDGVTEEDNFEFFARAEASLSERSPNTRRGIQVAIFENFDTVESLDVVGYGDPEMQRDILKGTVTSNQGTPTTVVHTAGTFTGIRLDTGDYNQLGDWAAVATQSNFPFTTKLELDFSVDNDALQVVYNRIENATYCQLYDTTDIYDPEFLSIRRTVQDITLHDAGGTEVTIDLAEKIHVHLDDFEVLAAGSNAETTPGYEARSQGIDLREDVGSMVWRAAPLPFTDKVYIDGSSVDLDSLNVLFGRDFLVVRGYQTGTPATEGYKTAEYWRVYPLRQNLGSGWFQVARTDYSMLSRRKITLPFTYEYSPILSAGREPIEIINFGAVGPDGESFPDCYDGINTMSTNDEYQGGVALWAQNVSPFYDRIFVELKEHTSRPNGWESLGVQVGHYISLAGITESGATYSAPTGADLSPSFEWWMWGRVSAVGVQGNKHLLKVEGIDYGSINGFNTLQEVDSTDTEPFLPSELVDELGGDPSVWFSFTGGENRFKLNWTVYRGELEVLTPNGNLTTSYEDFVYPPAYDLVGTGFFGDGRTPADSYLNNSSNVKIDADDTDPFFDSIPCFRLGDANILTSPGSGYGPGHPCNWAIVRLEQPFTSINLASGSPLIESEPAALPIYLGDEIVGKYPEYNSGMSIPGVVLTPVTLPLGLQMYQWTNVGSGLADLYENKGNPNSRGARGDTIPDFINTSADAVLQFLAPSEDAESNPIITISDIPGSYPFQDEFEELVVRSDEVHIGGMIDVYLKGSSPSSDSTEIPLYPKDIEVGVGGDLNYEAVDGTIYTASPTEIESPSLASLVEAAEFAELKDLVLEITDASDTDIIGRSVRIVDTDHSNNTLRLSESLNDTGSDIEDVAFRIYTQVTTNLNAPRRVLLTGNDLFVPLEESYVLSATGFTEIQNNQFTMYLEILEGDSAGEYAILEVEATKLVLDGLLSGPEVGVAFQIYSKQFGVETPLIRIKSVTFTTEEGSGVSIPYRHPVDLLAESFSGLNNDPLEFTNELTLRQAGDYTGELPAHAEGTFSYAHLFVQDDASYDWVASGGISIYDVVKLTTSDEETTYWWVRDVVDAGTGTNSVLVLDRDLAVDQLVTLGGLVGKPSLGTVRAYFMEPTYFEVSYDSVLQTLDEDLSFRPSPAEEADIYETGVFSASAQITPGDPTEATISSTSLDFARLGIEVGDVIWLERISLVSNNAIVDPDDMNDINGKILLLLVDGVQYSVTFTSDNTLTLTDVVNQINNRLGSSLRAEIYDDGGDKYLKLISPNTLQILDSSPGVLAELDFTIGQNNIYSDTGNIRAEVTGLAYDTGTGTSTLEIDGEYVDPAVSEDIFFRVIRQGYQRVYPAQMIPGDNGLYYYDFRAASRFPLTDEVVSENTQMTIEGYNSFGYELVVENTNYSFSGAERLDIVCTPLILPSYTFDISTAFVTPASTVVVSYERSQVVDDVQSFLLQDFNRVVCSNPLARHFLPAYLYTNLQVRTTKSLDTIKAAVVKYVLSLFPNKTLETFDVEVVLYKNGVTYVAHPVDMFFLTHNEDRSIKIFRSESSISLDNKYHIMEDEDHITLESV